MNYKGYVELLFNDSQLAYFYNNKKSYEQECGLKENQYLLIKDKTGEVVDKYCFQNGELRQVMFHKLGGTFTGAIKPRNPQQICLFDMLKDKTSKIKLVTGRFGSGKTMAMTVAALELIEKGKFDKIVWVRNNVSVKDAPEIGFLPGTEIDKLMPYVMPLADHAGGDDAGSDFPVGKNQACKNRYQPILFILDPIDGRIFDGCHPSRPRSARLRNCRVYCRRHLLRGRGLIHDPLLLLAVLHHRYEGLRKNDGDQHGDRRRCILPRVAGLFPSFV